MENCIYNGKEICSFDLKDKEGYYDYDLVEGWKLAANKGKLICSDCGQRVYLAAGPIKEPYFAHYDIQTCPYGNLKESEEMKKGKRLLYNLLKRSFPEHDIRARYRMQSGMYSTCYVINPDGQDIAIDYRLSHSSIDSFYDRDTYYKENGIVPIYILGISRNNGSNQISWYSNLIQKSIGLCVFLNVWNEKMVFKKSFEYRLGKQRKVRYCEKEFPIEGLILNDAGIFECDFYNECSKIEQVIKESKDAYYENIKREKIKYNRQISVSSTEDKSIRPDILNNAIKCLERGEGYLVSKKYLDYIREHHLVPN